MLGKWFCLIVFVLAPWFLFSDWTAAAGEKEFSIGVCVMAERHPHFRDMVEEIKKEADKVNVRVLVGNADFQHDQQVRIIEDFIRADVSMIMVAPFDARRLVSTLEKAGRAGIPVMTIDAAVGGYATISHCASDNFAGGRLAAGVMLEELGIRNAPEEGLILVLDHIGMTSTYLRVKGFRDVMALRGRQYTLVAADAVGQSDLAKAKTLSTIASVGKDLVGVFASSDDMTDGVLRAVEEVGRTGDMVLIGYGSTRKLKEAVDSGQAGGVVVQFPRKIGNKAFQIAYDYLTGKDRNPPREALVEVGTYTIEGLMDQRGNIVDDTF